MVKNGTLSELNKDQLDNEKLEMELKGAEGNLNEERRRLEGLE